MKSRKKKILHWVAVAAAAFVLATLAALAYLRWGSPIDRDWTVAVLASHYHAPVQLQSFSSSLFPTINLSGSGLTFSRPGQPDATPIISVQSFDARARWFDLLGRVRTFRSVTLRGLVINVPPRQPKTTTAASSGPPAPRGRFLHAGFVLGSVDADGTVLRILPAAADKDPLEFDMQRLRLKGLGGTRGMKYEAILTNPKPLGQIATRGTFGPWNADVPADTPVAGTYAFTHADLATLPGLAGTLSSNGSYAGPLDRLTVTGATLTPDFALGDRGHSESLTTHFQAVVDGMNGNTELHSVDVLLNHSRLQASGEVIEVHGRSGKSHHIEVQVSCDDARIDDLLRLAVKEQPPLTGQVRLRTKMDIAPGHTDVIERLSLDGTFQIHSAWFTDPDTESKLAELSWRGSARDSAAPSPNTRFEMGGHFALDHARMTFRNLQFGVPGAIVRLDGNYNLDNEQLDFHGTVALAATLSQAVGGVRSILIRPFNPLFRGADGGTELPILITGTRSHPQFRVEIRKKLHWLP